MEIVIKIDDERYKDIQRIAEVQLDRGRFQTAEQVIANGIPLPKGHAEPMQGKALGVEVPSGYVLRKEPRDTKVLILIPKRIKDKLQAKADLQRRSTNDLINEILEREVNKIKALEQESVLDKVRAEIAECGSIWVAYAITGHSDRDIENLIEGVLKQAIKQAKEQVLNIIDKYRTESEE